jgi:hypothetical protein
MAAGMIGEHHSISLPETRDVTANTFDNTGTFVAEHYG